ncbi:MAG: carboxypeptidase-like regulatory domain-containing protein [Bacteroidales bacterium]
MKTKQILLLLLLFIPCFCYSQTVTIKGNVLAVADGLPVDNVNILIKGTNIGVSSDKNGKFVLNNVKLPAVLKVSHLAFFSQDISLTKADVVKKNTIILNIQLSDRATSLSEVTIEDKPNNRIERLVYDFEVDDNYVYLICNKKDKRQLQVYTFDDYRKRSQELPKGCNEIGFDSRHYLYVRKGNRIDYWRISSEDTILTYLQYDSLLNGMGYIIANPKNHIKNKHDVFYLWYAEYHNLIEGYTSQNLYKEGISLAACMKGGVYCSNNKGWFGQYRELYRMYLDETGVIKYKRVYYCFLDIDEWLNFNVRDPKFKRNILRNLSIDNNTLNTISLINKSAKILDDYYHRVIIPLYIQCPPYGVRLNPFHLYAFYMDQLTPIPVYFVATKHNLYIFNYDKGLVHKVDENNYLLSTIRMDEIVKKDYRSDIFFNREGTRCFVRQNNNTLKELDLNKGEYIKTITLPQNRIEKIRIVGNYIYYTASVEGANALERQLFKIKLDK